MIEKTTTRTKKRNTTNRKTIVCMQWQQDKTRRDNINYRNQFWLDDINTNIHADEELNRKEEQKTICLLNKDYLKIDIFSSTDCSREKLMNAFLEHGVRIWAIFLVNSKGHGEHFALWSQWSLRLFPLQRELEIILFFPPLGSLFNLPPF